MQVEPKNNYNVMGKMGPLQPRPEYRPKTAQDGESPKAGQERGGQNPERLQRERISSSASQAGKLSLQSAKALTEATCEAIADLDPSARKCPHSSLSREAGMMSPRYV
jgi:hypothetical protein